MSIRGRIESADGTYAERVQLIGSNAQGAVTVIPNDGADLATKPTKGIYVGGSGDLKVTLIDGSTITFTNISSGTIHPLAVKRVFATGTTATGVLAVY